MTETRNKPIIRVEDVTVAYGDFVVVRDISFEVRAGEVFVILGGSGCGKSTLLKSMIGLNKPVRGRVLIDGMDIVTAEGSDLLAIFRKLGVMYQNGALFGSMNLLENIGLVLEEFTSLPRGAREGPSSSSVLQKDVAEDLGVADYVVDDAILVRLVGVFVELGPAGGGNPGYFFDLKSFQ